MAKIQWEETAARGKNHALLLMDQVARVYQNKVMKKHLGYSPDTYRQFDGKRWFSEHTIKDYVNALKSIESKQAGNLLRIANDYIKVLDNIRVWADKNSKINFKKLPNKKLKSIFVDYDKVACSCLFYAYHYIILNKFYPDLLTEIIAKKIPNNLEKQNKVLKILFSLDKASDTRQEKKSILEITGLAEKHDLKSEKMQKMIKVHCENFGHLGFYYYWGNLFTKTDIIKRLIVLMKKNLGKDLADLKEQELVKAKTQKIIKELNLDKNTQLIIKTIKDWGYAANHFDETYDYLVCKMNSFLKEICKRSGITWNQLASMRYEEIILSLEKGKVNPKFKKELTDRYHNHALIFANDRIKVLTGKKLKEYYKKEKFQEESYHHLKELKGQSASPGKVTGKVHLVLFLEEIAKVKKGEILVAPATTPSYVSAMEKAAAIVTNEGGLLSHAAIVSRELGVPCVVGTKIGTKALQNGDLVEVDANLGIVQKIDSNHQTR